jgi:Fructose-2,6-bisphosphatase
MRLSIIRHGITEANERHLYCGRTDLSLSEQGRENLVSLKETVSYPVAAVYITSGLTRASESLRILYERESDIIMDEFNEMDFGDFEMKSYEDLKDEPEYQHWIENIESAACPCGENRIVFDKRILAGFDKLCEMKYESAVVLCHGGVIVSIMERLFPGQRNFYEWQSGYGRGYTLDISSERAASFSEI